MLDREPLHHGGKCEISRSRPGGVFVQVSTFSRTCWSETSIFTYVAGHSSLHAPVRLIQKILAMWSLLMMLSSSSVHVLVQKKNCAFISRSSMQDGQTLLSRIVLRITSLLSYVDTSDAGQLCTVSRNEAIGHGCYDG